MNWLDSWAASWATGYVLVLWLALVVGSPAEGDDGLEVW